MASSKWTPLQPNADDDFEMRPSDRFNNRTGEETPDPSNNKPRTRGQGLFQQSDLSFASHDKTTQPVLPLGRPKAKKGIHTQDLWTAALSFTCLGLAILVVADDRIAWHLGQGDDDNNQLIVVGFLLSIMNLCTESVAPTLFLLMEARFGPSTLQNYQGLLRNEIIAERLHFVWRVVLCAMVALPLGVSAAYKGFSGGHSTIEVRAANYVGNASYYGMFAPPGLQPLGNNLGIWLFSNATLPFAVASSYGAVAPDFPTELPTPYGFNVLMLSNESTAMLDIPQPDYVSAVQSKLAIGESWTVSAPVYGTVSTFNNSKTTDPDGWDLYFQIKCKAAKPSDGFSTTWMYNPHYYLTLLGSPSIAGDQTHQYIGYIPWPNRTSTPSCLDFAPYAQLYNIYRQSCHGTWSITRGSILLKDGSCDGPILPAEKQQLIVDNALVLELYMASLFDFLGIFVDSNNQSDWASPYMATGVAAMLWSRITALDGASNMARSQKAGWTSQQGQIKYTFEEAGLVYQVDDTPQYTRPTLKKSGLLYCVFLIQPVLLVVMLVSFSLLHSTPLDRGFGLVSILSGVDRESLDGIAGASLSGELEEDVKLIIRAVHAENKESIQYQVTQSSPTSARTGRLVKATVYH
ncbi:uncharacterized protein BCR38DRAFT_411478 [Pseudomassariella vexata]|uniref:Uncharacterized protein n=1 Tax=Pseudomassariella vexata TaxID=1141098 RepID=A0A1Y2DR07_9PEZI|nr:uncharacterized protein BCR38DRAFT_411478 [Pseudomassariella vexata]ORY61619.1 hypothetical protein BCR38DRAFT_411478 [Pseudomassariella vexata]